MKMMAMPMLLKAASRNSLPAFGPTHSTRIGGVGDSLRTQRRTESIHELVALGLELDLDLAVPGADDLWIVFACSQLDARDGLDSLSNEGQVWVFVVAQADLVTAWRELDFGRLLGLGALVLRRLAPPAVA